MSRKKEPREKEPRASDSEVRKTFAETADDLGDVERLAPLHRPAPESKAPRKAVHHERETRFEAITFPDDAEPLFGHRAGVSEATLRKLRSGQPRPEVTIDLHGMRHDQAHRHLCDCIEAAIRDGRRCVLVIHGRGLRSSGGEAVLKSALPEWLGQAPLARHVRAVAPARRSDGGDGASYLLLA